MFGNNKPFGTASTFGSSSFGATPSPFGQTNTFGAKPATSNVFGGTTFGAAQPQAGLFGAPASTAGTGIFGQQPTTFGQPAPTSGGSFAFGNAPAAGGSLFGASTPATQQNTGLFGGSSTSAFGSPRPAFGGFGGTTTGSGLFGQNTSTGLFGTSGGFGATATSGTTIKFNPPTGTDTMMKGGVSQNISTRHQCITCMKEYENKSLEELRLEDYSANRKGPPAGSTLGGFGAPAQTGLFGQPAASTSAFSFGTTQAKTPFGATSGTNTFGTAGAGLFGQTNQPQNTGLFGKPTGFGTATTTSSGFNFGTTQNTSLFGQTNQQKPLFGQPTPSTGLFGQPATTQSTSFGMNTGFGGFGTTTQPTTGLFGAKPTGFGTANTTTTNTFSFGGSNTGGTGLFGAKPAGTAFGTGSTFGNTSTPFGGFGTNTGTTTSIFGQTKPTLGFGTTGNTFGTGLSTGFGTTPFSNTGLSTNTGLFGNTLTNKPAGFGFNNANTSFGGFGQTNTSAFNFGGVPGAMNANDPMAAVAHMQQQLQAKQIFAFNANPFGDNPLFRNALHDSKRREELLKPTNPAAQKAILANSQYKVSPLPASKVKPKPITPIVNGKVSLFDGLEDEEPSLGNETFVPKRNFKKLVLKPKSNNVSDLSLNISDISTNSRNEIPQFSSPFSRKVPPSPNVSLEYNYSPPTITNPNPAEVFDRNNNEYTKDSSKEKTSNSPLTHLSFTYKSPPLNVDCNRNQNPDDTIEILKPKNTNRLGVSTDSDNQLNESDLVVSNKENINDFNKPHVTGIRLQRPEYYTIPSLDELTQYIDDEGNCYIDNFTIGRVNYGKVRFKERMNVANLNLDELVHFHRKEITVYPDDDNKPPYGEGLNRRAEITLECVYPPDKSDRTSFVTDPKRIRDMKYPEKIENSTKKLGAKFIDYKPETGTWIFEVDHFSKYALEDSDEEDTTTTTQVKTVEPSKMPLGSLPNGQEHIQSNVVIDKFPVQKKLRMQVDDDDDHEMHDVEKITESEMMFPPLQRFIPSQADSEHIQRMKISCFLDDVEDNYKSDVDLQETVPNFGAKMNSSFFKPIPVRKPISINFSKSIGANFMSESLDNKVPYGSINLDKFNPKSHGPFTLSTKALSSRSLPQDFVNFPKLAVCKVRKLSLKPFEKSLLHKKENYIADIGLFNGRRFRVGWAPNMIFTHPTLDNNSEDIQSSSYCGVSNLAVQRNISASSNSMVLTISKVNILQRSKTEVDNIIKVNLKKSLKIQLQHSVCDIENGCPLFIPKPSNDALHAHAKLLEVQVMNMDSSHADAAFVKQCYHVWQLCVALWGEIPSLDTNHDDSDYTFQMARREMLSYWLIETCRDQVQIEINNNGFNPQGYLSTILSHLSIRQVAKAVHLAQEHHDHGMAKLIAQVEGNSFIRKLVLKQLVEWKNSKAYKLISHERLKIFALIGGLLFWDCDSTTINCCENLDWRRSFAFHLWYSSIPTSTIKDALTEFERSFQDSNPKNHYSRPPNPPYMESLLKNSSELKENSGRIIHDTCFHLLKLYCDRSHRLDKLLLPEASTPSQLDYRLSWFLHQALNAIEYKHLPLGNAVLLHINFAVQLESMGLWQWAIFVVLHIQNSHVRTMYVKNLLLKYLPLDASEQSDKIETFLHSQLFVPKEWIFEAKAVRAHSFGRIADEAWYLLKAGCYSNSHKLIVNHLASEAIINEDYDYLLKFLKELAPPERSSKIIDWASGGQVFLIYIHISQKVESFLKGEVSASEVEELWPDVLSLCKRLSSLNCLTAKDRLCQSEMAKKTATLLRAVLSLKEEKSGDSSTVHTLAPCVKNLPMPEEYAIQELRNLASDYMLAVTSE